MALVCSCGTQLVDGAKFCHSCGKPQFELPEVEEPVISPEASAELLQFEQDLVELSQAAQEVSFSNSHAVRVGLLVAIVSICILLPLSSMGGVSLLAMILPTIPPGVLAVFLYQRRTGVTISVLSGARLGWITGTFSFAFFLILFTVSFIPAIESGEFIKMQEMALKGSLSEPDLEKVKKAFEDPTILTMFVLFFMGIYFVITATLTSLGGMLGAKLLGRD